MTLSFRRIGNPKLRVLQVLCIVSNMALTGNLAPFLVITTVELFNKGKVLPEILFLTSSRLQQIFLVFHTKSPQEKYNTKGKNRTIFL